MANLTTVEFALCVLAMFGRVLDENRMAVHVLLEAIKSYVSRNHPRLVFLLTPHSLSEPFDGPFRQAGGQAGWIRWTQLSASDCCIPWQRLPMKEIKTEEGAQAILHTILDPVLGSLTWQELAKMRKDVDEGIRLASSAPLEEVRARVAGFIVDAWKDGRREHWTGVWNK
ncbi:unnamed protein product [Rhizoctonia solani]|uniref:Uncharacterized protein n=1 Tax=Rhizoctonia solani TaxID=456999 RepID=A0A8H3D880_9AGAM|nr:unnamed protein product [Rhizoctonia solani]